MRTCIGCRRTTSPDELVRVVRRADGTLAVGRHEPGRGAWLCAESVECVEIAFRRHAFDRAFRQAISLAELEGLRSQLTR